MDDAHKLRAIGALEQSRGWTDFLRPYILKRMDDIAEKILETMPEESTLRLRIEHEVLRDVLATPAKHRKMVEERLAVAARQDR